MANAPLGRAPSALAWIWEVGSKDDLIRSDWADVAKARLRQAYLVAGKPDQLEFHPFDGGHRWDGATVAPLLARVLKRD